MPSGFAAIHATSLDATCGGSLTPLYPDHMHRLEAALTELRSEAPPPARCRPTRLPGKMASATGSPATDATEPVSRCGLGRLVERTWIGSKGSRHGVLRDPGACWLGSERSITTLR